MAGIQRICERELDLEPDGSLRRVLGARVERVYWLYRKAL
jgi:hypothetical protein